jgi:acyl-CoA reductase-like NAD-dependent aldehyde dehydrogenase
VINIVPAGREVGAYLVEHPGVDKIAFTGSTAAGRKIAERCGALLRPVTLELGGKSAAIVLDDADIAANVQNLFSATLLNNGQTCFLGTRVLAPKSRYDEVVEIFGGLAGALKVGDAMDPTTQIGPMVSKRQQERVEGYIAKGKAEGARVVTGEAPAQERGWFVTPTVFADVENSHTIAKEEIFGPVLSVIPYDSDDEAVAIANDSEYGLGGSVWTADKERGEAVARRVQTGSIGINHYMIDPAAPFGGVKASGLGRELGPEGLEAYLATQSIYTKQGPQPGGA